MAVEFWNDDEKQDAHDLFTKLENSVEALRGTEELDGDGETSDDLYDKLTTFSQAFD
jgi:hypothetical protein